MKQFFHTLISEIPGLHCLITSRTLPQIGGIEIISMAGLTSEESRLLFQRSGLSRQLLVDTKAADIFVDTFRGHPLSLKIAAQLSPEQLENISADQIQKSPINVALDKTLKRLDIVQLRALEVLSQFDEPVNLQDPVLAQLFEKEFAGSPQDALQALTRTALVANTKDGTVLVHDVIRNLTRQQSDLRTALRVNQAIATYYQRRGEVLRAAIHFSRADMQDEAVNTISQHVSDLISQGHALRALHLLTDDLDKPNLQVSTNMERAIAIGSLSELLGMYEQAITYYENALSLARKLDYRQVEGIVLSNLGKAYANLARYQDATEVYNRALVIARDIGDRLGESNAINRLGEIYEYLQDYSRSLESYERALTIAREIDDIRVYSTILNNMGVIHLEMARLEEAVFTFEKALAVAREIGDRRSEGLGLSNLGMAYTRLGEPQRAIEFFEQALVIAREIGDRRGEGIRLINLRQRYMELDEPQLAITLLQQASVVAREIADRSTEGQALWYMSLSLDKLDQRLEAIAQAEAALKILESLHHPIASTIHKQVATWHGNK